MQILAILHRVLSATALVTLGLLYLHNPQGWSARAALVEGLIRQAMMTEAERQILAERGPMAVPAVVPGAVRVGADRVRLPDGRIVVLRRQPHVTPVARAKFQKAWPATE